MDSQPTHASPPERARRAPRREYRPDGKVERLIVPDEAHLFCHPTNLAFWDSTLFTIYLGRWHIMAVNTEADG